MLSGQLSKDKKHCGPQEKKLAAISHFRPKRPKFKMISNKIVPIDKAVKKGRKKSLASRILVMSGDERQLLQFFLDARLMQYDVNGDVR